MKKRNSSIELLKIVGLLAIIVSHIVQTLTNIGAGNFVIDISHATNNISALLLSFLRYLGAFGNTIFFVSTAWFLIDSKELKPKKALFLIVNTWTISVIILAISVIWGVDVSNRCLIRSLLPVMLQANWYVTCYVLFYLFHPLINNSINRLSQRQHLRVMFLLLLIYIGLCSLKGDLLYGTKFTIWIAIYVAISYLKKYALKVLNSKKVNLIAVAAGIIGIVGLLLVTNFVGLYFSAVSNKLQHWAINNNPFIIMTALGLFNLVRQKEFTSKTINTLASVSLYVYIIHENIIIRTYLRPAIWTGIYNRIGHDYLYVVILCMSLAFFIASTVLGLIYSKTIQRIVNNIINRLYAPARRVVYKIESRLMDVK